MSDELLATLYKSERRLEIRIRDGFDTVDRQGIKIVNTDVDRKEMHEVLDEAIDIMLGKRRSVMDPERWAHMNISIVNEAQNG